jgi:hypothetical protein
MNSSLKGFGEDAVVIVGSVTIHTPRLFPDCAKLRVIYFPMNDLLNGGAAELRFTKLGLAMKHAAPVDWVVGQGVLHFFEPFDAKATEMLKGRDGVPYADHVHTMLTLSKEALGQHSAWDNVMWMTTHLRNEPLIQKQYLESQSNAAVHAWNEVARLAARQHGATVVDVENATLPYINDTLDGTHFWGTVQEGMADRLLRAMCVTSTVHDSEACAAANSKLYARTLSKQRAAMDKQTYFHYAFKLERCFKCFAHPSPMAAFPWELSVREVSAHFQEADTGAKGWLAPAEFKSALTNCDPYIPLNEAQASGLMRMGQDSAKLTEKEFLRVYDRAWAFSRMGHAIDLPEDKLSAAFKANAESNGKLSVAWLPPVSDESVDLFDSSFGNALVSAFSTLPAIMDHFRQAMYAGRLANWGHRMFATFDANRSGDVDMSEWKGFFSELRKYDAQN